MATSDLCIGTLGDLAEVILSSSGDASKEDLFGDTSSQSHAHAVQKLLLGVQVLFPGKVLGVTQALPSWDDGHLQSKQTAGRYTCSAPGERRLTALLAHL